MPGGPEVNTIGPILQDHSGDIWIGSYGLIRIHDGRFRRYRVADRRPNGHEDEPVSALWADRDGAIILGYDHGIKTFKLGRVEQAQWPLSQIKSRVNAILRDRSNALWMGTGEGLYRYRDSKLNLFSSEKGPLRGEVRALAEDKTGSLWIGTDDVLCRYRAGSFSCFGPRDGLSHWSVRSIAVDSNNVVWVSTANLGVLRIAGESFRWIQAKDGLYSNDVAGILDDGKGYFWIGCQLGIFRVSKEELNALLESRADRVTSSVYGKSDGLDSSNSTGFGQPRGFVAQNGTLWFPTSNGLATINPNGVPFDRSLPRAQIESCSMEQRAIPCAGPIRLSPGIKDFEIQYTALTLTKPEQIQFRYRMDPLDKSWVDVGTRRTAYYSHLPPGEYQFSVAAANTEGIWNASESRLQITVEPFYYQTLWFRSLAAAAVAGLFLFAWRVRAAQYNKRQVLQRAFAQQIIASQENERKRIAGELHDGLGQRLAVIRNMVLLMNGSGDREERHQRNEAIAAETSQAIDEVRRISRNLRPYRLDMLGLTRAVEALAAETCDAAGIRADVVVCDLSGVFPEEAEIHFYRIVQECLSNIVKHSRATAATIVIQRVGEAVSLVVSDDGTGFPAGHPEGHGSGGFGLTGISERAKLLGGRATVQSAPGQGTAVTVEVQCGRTAYAR